MADNTEQQVLSIALENDRFDFSDDMVQKMFLSFILWEFKRTDSIANYLSIELLGDTTKASFNLLVSLENTKQITRILEALENSLDLDSGKTTVLYALWGENRIDGKDIITEQP